MHDSSCVALLPQYSAHSRNNIFGAIDTPMPLDYAHSAHSSAFFDRIIINNKVYDVTKFLKLHPGGKKILLGVGGQECTEQFNQFHNAAAVIAKYGPKLFIGDLEGSAAASAPKKQSTAVVVAAKPKQVVMNIPSSISHEAFGEQTPYGDPAWYQGSNSPVSQQRD